MDFLDRYKFDYKKDLLGRGGFGEVYKAYDTLLNRDVALKFYKGRGASKYDLISEIKKIIKLNHPNLLQFYDASILTQENAIGRLEELQVGIMELANEGDLVEFMQTNPSREEIKIVTLGILSGLSFMHKNGFIHRDLKPQNILFVRKGRRITPKIADFGISKNALGDDAGQSTKLVGTVEYMAPELFNPQFAIDGKASYNLDLWALGVMLFELLSGNPAYGRRSEGINTEHIMHNICYKETSGNIDDFEEPFKTVLKKCLVKDANKRVKTADELIEFIKNYKEEEEPPITKPEEKDLIVQDTITEKANVEKVETQKTKKKLSQLKAIGIVGIIGAVAIALIFLYPRFSNSNAEDGDNIELSDNKELTPIPVIDSTEHNDSINDTIVNTSDTLKVDSLNVVANKDSSDSNTISEDAVVEQEMPENIPNRGKMSIEALLNDYNNCGSETNGNYTCSSFTSRAVCKYYGVEDLKRGESYISNFEIHNYISTSGKWQNLGMAYSQQTLNDVQQLANVGIPVIAISTYSESKLAVMIVKGKQSSSSSWGLSVPACAAFLPSGEKAVIGKSLNWVWKSPDGIQFWMKK